MRLCLNCIVKNESARIERMLASVAPYISCFAIADTGSTDNTKKIIGGTLKDIPGAIVSQPFVNFEQARNDALRYARTVPFKYDYLLLVDADMELVVEDPKCFDNLTGPSYDMEQRAGSLVYANRRLLKRTETGLYKGATHEYLNVDSAGTVTGAHFIDHADGSNRVDKFQRDIDLLVGALRTDPNNPRHWFYLAQSYRDSGQWERAARAYLRRAEMGGWDEEAWNARTNYAFCLKNLNDEGGFVLESLKAYAERPTRAEPLYDLANHSRLENRPAISTLFSEAGMQIQRPNDQLFVNDYVYKAGLREEFSITAFYDPLKRDLGFRACSDLSLDASAPPATRDLARQNLYHYLKPLSDYASSFASKSIPNPSTNGYTALNPSVTSINGKLFAVVRTVNYRIDDEGRYLIKGTDGTANDSNPIDTVNYLCALDENLDVTSSAKMDVRSTHPVNFPLVRGLEDMRLFQYRGLTWVSATVRENLTSGMPVQVLARVHSSGIVDAPRMMSDGSTCEKNWMPYTAGDGIQFCYRLGRFVNGNANTTVEHKLDIDASCLNGGTQLIPFFGGSLALVHEARHIPGKWTRYYMHRFVWFDVDLKLRHVSLPFFFHERQIEFAAGMCWRDANELVISYGVRDEEAVLATVNAEEIREFVFHGC